MIPAVGQALVQQFLLQRGNKAAEDVACAEVYPDRVFLGGGGHGRMVELGQLDAQLFPLGFLIDDGRGIHLHSGFLLCSLLVDERLAVRVTFSITRNFY